MSEVRYFKTAMALPLVLPLAAWLVSRSGFEDPTPLTALLVGSILIGGIPYAFCAAAALWWLRRRSAADHRRLASIAPIAFSPFLALTILVTESLGRVTWSLDDIIVALLWSIPSSMLFGYGYLALVLVARRLMVRGRPGESLLAA